ncbi:MAG: hypothetical protein ACK553_13340 [Planctomycetota bacterium]
MRCSRNKRPGMAWRDGFTAPDVIPIVVADSIPLVPRDPGGIVLGTAFALAES